MNAPMRPHGMTDHALDRYAEFYGTHFHLDVVAVVDDSEVVLHEVAMALTGRRSSGKYDPRDSEYRIHPERTGLFVVDTRTRTVVTFLRFGKAQYDTAARLFPGGAPVSPSVPWSSLLKRQEVAPARTPTPKPKPRPRTFLGVPVADVQISIGARAALANGQDWREALLMAPREAPGVNGAPPCGWTPEAGEVKAEAALKVADGWLMACRVDGVLKVVKAYTPPPKADRICPLSGVDVRGVKVPAGMFSQVEVDGAPAQRKDVRAALLTAEPVGALPNGWRLSLTLGGACCDAWLVRFDVGGGRIDWNLLDRPPVRLDPADLERAAALRAAGWVVVPPA